MSLIGMTGRIEVEGLRKGVKGCIELVSFERQFQLHATVIQTRFIDLWVE